MSVLQSLNFYIKLMLFNYICRSEMQERTGKEKERSQPLKTKRQAVGKCIKKKLGEGY